MLHGTYIGIRNRLKYKTALLQKAPGGWRAQFYDMTLKEGYGWHWFPESAFRVHHRGEWQ